MIRASSPLLRSIRWLSLQTRCFSSAMQGETTNQFKKQILETVLNENEYDQYSTIISANGDSLLDGFLETINRTTDRLLVVSNGFDGDAIAKKAFEMGISTDWCFHSTMFSMDPLEAAEDVANRPRITHVLFVHVDSFTGSITPLRSIINNVRKVRKDISICVDNRLAYGLHPMTSISSIIDYSIHDTSILNTSPSFGFCVCHKPAIMAQAHKHPESMFGSIYNRSMVLEKMLPSLQQAYLGKKSQHWTSTLYKYENTKSQLVNKLKLLLPLIPSGVDQSCYASAFLLPQENVRFRELIESLKEDGIPVDYKFITPGLPAISFKTKDLVDYEENGGDLMTIFKCVDRVVRKRSPAFSSLEDVLKQEKEYRTNYIYGDKKLRVCFQTEN